jgi:amino acid transporter
MYCFSGLSHANYSLSEVHNPARTLRIAGPLAINVAATFYLLCNIAFYAAASKEEITSSGRLVAALLFKNVWGSKAERFLNAFIAALGTALSIVCLFPLFLSQQCLIIREVVLPWSRESSSRKGRHPPIQLVLGIQLARGSTTRGP